MPGATRLLSFVHHAAAWLVVAAFMAPIAWWGLTSIKPAAAIFDRSRIVVFGFSPTFAHYSALLGAGPEVLHARGAVLDSALVAAAATVLTLLVALPGAYGLSRFPSPRRDAFLAAIVVFRFVPPIALIIPTVFLFRDLGLYDTRLGLVLVYATLNVPLALLMLKSFFDEVPREIDEAARLDGASGFAVFGRVALPLVRGGVAATAVLCLIFAWTEFLMAVFLTVSFRTLPVKMATLASADPGLVAALGTGAMLPAFLFVLLMRGHLVRGLTLGVQK